mgnify:CR=1 FL=1
MAFIRIVMVIYCPLTCVAEQNAIGLEQSFITTEVVSIFSAVFESTLEMINQDFETHPEHRRNFYNLLQAINLYCFEGM